MDPTHVVKLVQDDGCLDFLFLREKDAEWEDKPLDLSSEEGALCCLK